MKKIKRKDMSVLNLKDMNINDKLIAMEELWEDISKDINNKKLTPNWHIEILDKLEEKEKNGTLKFSSLQESKARLGNLV
jgi:hypothetical protein